MFDLSKILNEIKDAIQIIDGPDDLSIDLLIKGVGTSGEAGAVNLGMPNIADKDSIKQMLKTAGLSDKDVDFEIEQIEGGMRYRFASKGAKEKMKEQMTQLFQGDMLQKLFEGLMGAFSNLGSQLGEAMGKIGTELGETMGKLGADLGESGEAPSEAPQKSKREEWIGFDGAPLCQPAEIDALRDLCELIGEPVPRVMEVDMDTFGFLVEGGSVTQLGLAGKGLTSLPESFGNFTSLQYLKLNDNKLTALPASFGRLHDLQGLDLPGNELTTLPASIGKLKMLRWINAPNNKLKSLPESIGQLASLEQLNVHDNQLSTLPKSIVNLKSLERIYIRGNKFPSRPKELEKLTALKEID